MNVLAVLLVMIGLIALALSLVPLTSICRHDTGYRSGWRAMLVLVLVFISGYIFFCYHLFYKVPGLIDFILAGIFLGGGLFVFLVSRMSLASLNEMQATAAEHQKQALHDALTGLPNRKSLMLTLENTIAASGRVEACFAVMVMDLNGFKEVNDTLGHQAGDAALQIIAPRLNRQLRESDTLCRMGGDEFAIILPQTNKADAALVAEKILAAIAEAMMIDKNTITIGISIGIALSPDHAQDGNTLLRYADIAMYQAKHQNTGIEMYSKEIDSSLIETLSDVPELLQALRAKKLVTSFQPVLAGEYLKGLEVSLSWHKKDGAVATAQHFLKSIVDLGASWPLIEYVVDEALSSFSEWREQYGHGFNLRLNLFLGAVDRNELCDFLIAKAKHYNIPRAHIMIEVSESMLGRPSIINLMNRLHDDGFKVAVDDFGSNGAKLLLLKQVALDEVKLDRALVLYSETEQLDETLLQSLFAYCQRLNKPLVAPNIESEAAFLKLKEIGIHHFQGDILCPFIPVEEMNNWLKQYFEAASTT